jgi:hypothetical protein
MPNGTWVNVYKDPMEEHAKLVEFREDLIEAAMEVRGYAEANEVINLVRYK